MKKIVVFTAVIMFLISPLMGQESMISLSFEGDNNGDFLSLDSILLKNLTQNATITVYAPDTLFDLIFTGLEDTQGYQTDLLSMSQNFPNPFMGKTEFDITMSEKGILEIGVLSLLGKQIVSFQRKLDRGIHHFSFKAGSDKNYLLSATAFGLTKTIKLFSASDSKGICELSYFGSGGHNDNFKSLQLTKDFPFELGDDILFVGYNELGESGILDSPMESKTYTFQFATNIPCIGVPTIDYEGQIYNTIQIYSQCWFKENLNVGEMIPASQSQADNNIIEKYCPINNESYCDLFSGGLYLWSEMMDYADESGAQGICPEGWHIPAELDWQVLEGAVDSGLGIGNSEWGNIDWRGTDAGGNLKQTGTTNWEYPNIGATDAFGFSAIAGGYIVQSEYWGGGYKGYFWSSDIYDNFFRNLDWDQKEIKKDIGVGGGIAFTVRCIKD